MEHSKRHAVVIGISQYKEAQQIQPLPCAKNDAVRLAEDLFKFGQFKKEHIHLLTDNSDARLSEISSSTPTRANIFRAVNYVAECAEQGDLILIFFAGHGVEVSGKPYLLTEDTLMDVLAETGVKVAEINDKLEKSRARTIIRVFDACRSAFGETRGLVSPMTRGFEDAIFKTGTGWATFSSCSTGEVAHESIDFEHGIFSYYLCQGLEGMAARDDGNVTLDRLVDYVKTSVGNWCDQNTLKQTPHFQADLSGVVVLANIRVGKESAPMPAENPLDSLRIGIERHLSQIAQDARNLTFTDAKEMEKVAELAFFVVRNIVGEFRSPAISISISERKPLDRLEGDLWHWLHHDMNMQNVVAEFTTNFGENTCAVTVDFLSNEVVLPRTSLTVCVVRFSFFYWIWWRHVCIAHQLRGRFVAKPEFKSGFFTFKPQAAIEGWKIERSVTELFKRASEDIQTWADQLKEFVDGRLEPLRQVGSIVE